MVHLLSRPSTASTRLLTPSRQRYALHTTPTHLIETPSNSITAPSALTHPAPANNINPPHTTRPPPLHLPERQPSQSALKYYIALGKGYLTFYKTGIRSVYTNHQTCQLLKARLASTPPNPTPPRDPPPDDPFVREKRALSRAEFQQLVRHRQDMKRVPAFALAFAVFGEWLPLVVPFITKVVPGPCRLPGQVKKETEALETRRKAMGEAYKVASASAVTGVDVSELQRGDLMDLSRTFGLHARLWDRLGLDGVWPPTALLKRRVRRNMKYLAADDELLAAGDGKVGDLLEDEVRIACAQRGMLVTGRENEELVGEMEKWMGGDVKEKS